MAYTLTVNSQINIIFVTHYPFKEGFSRMAKNSVTLDNVALGIIAIVAGVLVIFLWNLAQYIIGIFLIVWGILSVMKK